MKFSKRVYLILATTAFIFSASAQSADSTLYGNNSKAGHYIKTRGFNIYYETYGKGEPLPIIQGNGGSINNFIYQIPFFS